MKTVYLLFTGIFLTLFVNTSIAQNFNKKSSFITSSEKKYNNETYIVDTVEQSVLRASSGNGMSIKAMIANKLEINLLKGKIGGTCYTPKETTPIIELFKEAISKEKIKSLAFDVKNKITIVFVYNVQTGQIIYTRFLLHGVPLSDDVNSKTDITLKDINKLETLFKEYYFEIPIVCEKKDIEYSTWNYPIRFSKLAEEEKEK